MTNYAKIVKRCEKTAKFHPFYSLVRGLVKLFFPRDKVIWQTEKPADDEPIFYVCNHTKAYAPIHFILQKKKVRVWANYYFMFYQDCWNHFMKKILGGKRKFLRPLAALLYPLIIRTFRALDPIPVFHQVKLVMDVTFEKSMRTMEDGISQVIFPERTENQVNRYVYEFNAGFPMVAESYYQRTGKKMKFYPTYCAQNLHTVVVGEPIEYDPEIPMKLQRKQICRYLEGKICEMGDSLPEHEPVIYG